jgi:hypothetical protein
MGDAAQPNTKLIDARMRIKSPTGSGNPMSRRRGAAPPGESHCPHRMPGRQRGWAV